MQDFRSEVVEWFKDFQNRLCRDLENCDGKARFEEDLWEREGGGGGRTRVIQNGNVFEKGGVNFSAVHGELPIQALNVLHMPDRSFFATGVSVVMHPENPMVPITHMNVRYFESGNGEAWFGGGIDLTPIYIDPKQAKFFHEQMKAVCNKHDPAYYLAFKKWADEYFFITHRNETRGIGGIFFDRQKPSENHDIKAVFSFVQDVANTFAPTYIKLVNENRQQTYTEKQKDWQLLRRGRYVEFNLAIDRGTRFGLETNGRTESILMSLPATASWAYNYTPEPGSAEEYTLRHLTKEMDWLKE